MLIVLAPALMTASITRQRKSSSERPASSGENSTSSVLFRACLTAATARSNTWSGAIRSLSCMWIGEVAMKVWMRGAEAGATAAAAWATSDSLARASPQILLSWTCRAIACTASKSPGLAAGNPASITSTCIFSSCRAMRIFSSVVIEAPGLCSPSRKVVSKTSSRSCIDIIPPKTTGYPATCVGKGQVAGVGILRSSGASVSQDTG